MGRQEAIVKKTTHPKKRKVGRPRLFSSPEQMQVKIDAYFAECDARIIPMQVEGKDGGIVEMSVNKPAPYTVAGLNLYLGFDDRNGMSQYAARFPEYESTCKKARARVENQREGYLAELPKGGNVAGIIFALKNGHGWRDKSEVEQTIKSDVPFVQVYPEEKNEKTTDPAKTEPATAPRLVDGGKSASVA